MNIIKQYWNDRPCNIRHSKSEFGTEQYYNEVEERKYFVEPHILEFAEFKKWEGKKVLEIGCGIGTDAVNFVRNGAIYTGIELSDKSLEITKNRMALFNLKANFYCGNAEQLDQILPLQSFDLIYLFGVLHHTSNPDLAINQIKQYMHPGSEFRLMLYSKYSTKNFMINIKLDQPEAQKGCPIAHTYSFKEVKRLLSDFDIISIKKEHIFPYKVEDYRRYVYNRKLWVKILPRKVFRFMENKLGWHTLIICKKSLKKGILNVSLE